MLKENYSESFSLVSHQRFIVYVNKGDHGYHNREMDMKMIFRAFGPDFKKNFLSEPFDSIHIYPLMCKLLEIKPAPHNGSLTVTENLLLQSGESVFCSELHYLSSTDSDEMTELCFRTVGLLLSFPINQMTKYQIYLVIPDPEVGNHCPKLCPFAEEQTLL